MAFRFRNLKVTEWIRLFGPFAVVAVLGLMLRSVYPPYWLMPDAFYSLADALMVAGVVGSLLEMFSAKFMIERVADDLAEKLVGRGLPKELQAHIRKITKTELVWGNYTKRYSLIRTEEAPDRMTMESEISFEVRNYSDLTKQYSPYVAEESFYSPSFKCIEYGLTGEKPLVFNEQYLTQKTQTTPGDRVKRVSDFPKIDLPPIAEGKFVKALIRYRVNMPLEYTDLTHFANPTTSVRIIVQDIPAGFDFSAEGEGAIHSPDGRSWDFLGPFVGGQHVRVRWFKRSPTQKFSD